MSSFWHWGRPCSSQPGSWFLLWLGWRLAPGLGAPIRMRRSCFRRRSPPSCERGIASAKRSSAGTSARPPWGWSVPPGWHRLASAGRPMGAVADELRVGLPESGALAAAAIRIGADSGGRMAAVFSTLAGIQSDVIDLGRDVGAATANVRASVVVVVVVVVGGLPVLGLVMATATGRLSEIVAHGSSGVMLVAVGVALLLAGPDRSWPWPER